MPIESETAHVSQQIAYHQIEVGDTAGDLSDWYGSAADPAFAPASGPWCTASGGTFIFHTVWGDSNPASVGDYVTLPVLAAGGQPGDIVHADDFPYRFTAE